MVLRQPLLANKNIISIFYLHGKFNSRHVCKKINILNFYLQHQNGLNVGTSTTKGTS